MRLFLKYLVRGLAVPAVPLVLLASNGCDTSGEAPSGDADVSDAATSDVGASHAVFVPNMSVPRATANDTRPGAAPAAPSGERVVTVTLSAQERLAQSAQHFMPILAIYPDLVATLAAGDLVSQANDLAPLPASIRALAGAPWLMHEGRVVLAAREPDASAAATSAAANPAGIDLDRLGLGKNAELVAHPNLFVARSALRMDAVPLAQRALVGRTVRVFDAHGERCVARVAGLTLESQLYHAVGEEYGADDKPVVPNHTASDVVASGESFLLATLDPIIGTRADCESGLWATPVGDSPKVQLFGAAPADRALVRQAVHAFRGLPEWRARQHDYRHFYADADDRPRGHAGDTRWDTYDNAPGPTVARLVTRDGGREILTVSANTIGGCGDPGQQMTALFEVTRDGTKVALTAIAELPWTDAPAGIADWNGDGTLELFYEGSSAYGVAPGRDAYHVTPKRSADDSALTPVRTFTVPDLTMYGCGC